MVASSVSFDGLYPNLEEVQGLRSDAELLVLESLDILSGINAQPEQSRTIKPQFRRRGGHEL